MSFWSYFVLRKLRGFYFAQFGRSFPPSFAYYCLTIKWRPISIHINDHNREKVKKKMSNYSFVDLWNDCMKHEIDFMAKKCPVITLKSHDANSWRLALYTKNLTTWACRANIFYRLLAISTLRLLQCVNR